MNTQHVSTRAWVAAVAIAHLIICLVHGMAHTRAQIPMSTAANLFVIGVILVGPLLGVSLLWRAERVGGGLIAVTLAAALAFGLVNHFLVVGPDHVARVQDQVWPLFTATAVLLGLTEAVGAGLAVHLVRGR